MNNDAYLKSFEVDLLGLGVDIRDLWRGKIGYPRLARYLSVLLRKDSSVSRIIGESPLSQTDSLLVDVVDGMNQVRYLLGPVAFAQIPKNKHNKFIKGAPEPIERPSNQPDQKPKKAKDEITVQPHEALDAVNAIIARHQAIGR